MLFLEEATKYPLKWVFPQTKQKLLKVAGYKPTTFVNRNSSRVIFKDF